MHTLKDPQALTTIRLTITAIQWHKRVSVRQGTANSQ